MTEDNIRTILTSIEEMLRDPSCEIRVDAGIRKWPNYKTGYMEAEHTGGRTVTISIKGGGGDVNESPEESMMRLRRDLHHASSVK